MQIGLLVATITPFDPYKLQRCFKHENWVEWHADKIIWHKNCPAQQYSGINN